MTALLAEFTNQGWQPGPGDPTLGGWIVFWSYWVAMVGAVLAWRGESRAQVALGVLRQPRFWAWLALALTGLAINKELDLHNAITWFGRTLARQEGWYRYRRVVQLVFIAVVLVAAAAFVFWSFRRVRHWPRYYRLPLAGIQILVAFIVVRAASFHHVDFFLRRHFGGIKLHALAEFTGIAVIGVAAYRAWWRDRALVRAAEGSVARGRSDPAS